MGGPGGHLFSRHLFGGARAALLSIFGSIWDPIGSPFGHILVPFGGLDFQSDFGAKSEAGTAAGAGSPYLQNLQDLQELARALSEV